MVRTAGSKLSLFLALLLLLECSWAADCVSEADWPWPASGDAPALCYIFNITANGQSWCDVEGLIRGNTFFNYTCGSQKIEPVSPLGMKVNDTHIWERLTETLKDLMDELKKKLLDIKKENIINTTIVSLSLQGRMTCQWEASGHTSASWEFGFDGKRFLCFELETRKYTVGHSGGKSMKKKWEHDEELTRSFTNIPGVECKEWHAIFKKELSTTALSTTAPATAPSTMAAATTQFKATTTKFITWILPVILTLNIVGT